MPFASASQEYYMQINLPKLWREWVRKYGHHAEYSSYKRKMKRRKSKISNKTSKRRKRS